jgi:hypothetical protein
MLTGLPNEVVGTSLGNSGGDERLDIQMAFRNLPVDADERDRTVEKN